VERRTIVTRWLRTFEERTILAVLDVNMGKELVPGLPKMQGLLMLIALHSRHLDRVQLRWPP
jgi:hypothetical protein